jgi:hypothetical protein
VIRHVAAEYLKLSLIQERKIASVMLFRPLHSVELHNVVSTVSACLIRMQCSLAIALNRADGDALKMDLQASTETDQC